MDEKQIARLKKALKLLQKEDHPVLILQVADEKIVLKPSELVATSMYVAIYLIDKA